MMITVSIIGLEFISSLESGFPGALHLQSTGELVMQYLSHGVLHHYIDNESRYIKTNSSMGMKISHVMGVAKPVPL